MATITARNLEKLVCAGMVVLGFAACASATLVDSNSIIKDGIEYYMQTDKAVYNLGEVVEMLYRVTNLRYESVEFHFDDQFQYYFEVTDNGTVIWFAPWVFEPATSWFVLKPNEYKEYGVTWNMVNDNGTYSPRDDFPVNPGSYDIMGSLNNLMGASRDKYTPVSVSIDIVPEPASFALLAIGMFALLAHNKKRKNTHNM